MFDIGGWELLLLGAIALIVVGPKDLPKMVREVGRWVARARGLANDFRQGMESAADEMDLREMRKGVNLDGLDGGVGQELKSLKEQTKSMIDQPLESPAQPQTSPKERPAYNEGAPAGGYTPGKNTRTPRSADQDDGAAMDDEAFLENFRAGVDGPGRRDK